MRGFWYTIGMSEAQTTDTIAVYNDIADSYADNVEHLYAPSERETFVSMIPKGGRILDAGCAGGRDSRYFDSQGYRVTGVDLSEKLLAVAKKKAPHIDFQQQDIRSLQFSDGSFDGIYASAVLLHLKRDELLPVLQKFNALLKPDGVMNIQVKEGRGDAVVSEKMSEGKARFFTYFQKEEMEQYLADAGFHIAKSHVYNEKDINPAWRNVSWISCFAKKK